MIGVNLALPAPISSFETIVGPIELPVSSTLLYTSPGLRRISDIYLSQDSNARDVTLHIVPAGATKADAHRFLIDFDTIANDLRPVTGLNYAIQKGWTIYGDSSGTGTNLVIIAYR